jgi:hypothetical protein
MEFFILKVNGSWRSSVIRSESNLARAYAGACCLFIWVLQFCESLSVPLYWVDWGSY